MRNVLVVKISRKVEKQRKRQLVNEWNKGIKSKQKKYYEPKKEAINTKRLERRSKVKAEKYYELKGYL